MTPAAIHQERVRPLGAQEVGDAAVCRDAVPLEDARRNERPAPTQEPIEPQQGGRPEGLKADSAGATRPPACNGEVSNGLFGSAATRPSCRCATRRGLSAGDLDEADAVDGHLRHGEPEPFRLPREGEFA